MIRAKPAGRTRRGLRARARIRRGARPRLRVHRTPRHMYAQVTTPDGARTLAGASTLEAEVAAACRAAEEQNKTACAAVVGEAIAKRALDQGVKTVAFDRAGFKYHGRVRALAEAARRAGLEF